MYSLSPRETRGLSGNMSEKRRNAIIFSRFLICNILKIKSIINWYIPTNSRSYSLWGKEWVKMGCQCWSFDQDEPLSLSCSCPSQSDNEDLLTLP